MPANIKTVCFTGHRSIPAETADIMDRILGTLIRNLITQGAEHFRVGGAVGFDTAVALKLIELKSTFPEIKIDLVLPCREQSAKWNDTSKTAYDFVLSHADSCVYTSEKYHAGCMLERDRRLVDGSDLCVAYCLKTSGGTAYTYAYALSKDVEVINVAEML